MCLQGTHWLSAGHVPQAGSHRKACLCLGRKDMNPRRSPASGSRPETSYQEVIWACHFLSAMFSAESLSGALVPQALGYLHTWPKLLHQERGHQLRPLQSRNTTCREESLLFLKTEKSQTSQQPALLTDLGYPF